MHVSDEAIVQYLDDLAAAMSRATRCAPCSTACSSAAANVSIDYVIDALARGNAGPQLHRQPTSTRSRPSRPSSGGRLARVNDRVVVEAAAIPADSLLLDVKEPTDAELTEFFDKYKDREPSPEIAYGTTELPSPTPGFRHPAQGRRSIHRRPITTVS